MKKSIFLLFLFLGQWMLAQEELSLFYHKDVIQSGQLVPAYAPKGNFHIGVGSLYGHMDLRGPRLTDFSFGLDYLNALADGLSNSYFSGDASAHAFDVGWRWKQAYWRIGYNNSSNAYFNFSPEFARLIFRGNGQSVGETIDIGPDLYIRNFSEFYVGMSYGIYDYYRLGGNLKFVSGNFDLSTPRSDLSLTTGEEFYELTLENDYLVNSSFNSLEFALRDLLPFSRPLQDNIGVSADFSLQYLTDNWDVSVNLLDVGLLRWRSNVINAQSEGKFTFDGFQLSEITKDTLQNLVDTLGSVFQLNLTNKAYSSYTPVKIAIAGEYHMDKWHFGGILYGEWKQNRFLPAAGVNIRRTLWKFWDIGMSYSYKNNTWSNFGLSSVMNIGPVQLYVLSDNVVGVFLPANRMKINFRVGGNLNFGRKSPKEKEPPTQHTAMW